MSKQRDILKRIVALKRQSAEQRVRTLQIEAERIEAMIGTLKAALLAVDEVRAGFDAHRLSEENGHVRKLLADKQVAQEALAVKRAEMHEAREGLKRAFHSEERLGQAAQKG